MQAADVIIKTYWDCLSYLGITPENHNGDEDTKDCSYNVWITPRMIFIVLRSKNTVEGPSEGYAIKPTIDINTLGFAGTIATKNQESFDFLK
jgi:ATP adenylyltransferase/5',5'''-P-1,P-4-tetraphosphate phosphorylase II